MLNVVCSSLAFALDARRYSTTILGGGVWWMNSEHWGMPLWTLRDGTLLQTLVSILASRNHATDTASTTAATTTTNKQPLHFDSATHRVANGSTTFRYPPLHWLGLPTRCLTHTRDCLWYYLSHLHTPLRLSHPRHSNGNYNWTFSLGGSH